MSTKAPDNVLCKYSTVLQLIALDFYLSFSFLTQSYSTPICQSDISNCALVTAWAAGCSWNEVLELSGGVPPGDLARTLSRALDGLRQLGNLEYRPVRVATGGIHPHVRQKCREAARAMDRYPVKDPLPFESDDDDDDETESPEIDLDVEATLAATKNVTE
jgi:hypothetical protein